MNNTWIMYATILVNVVNSPLFGMNESTNEPIQEFFTRVRNLPQELQDPIITSQDAIQFLGLAPVTLEGHPDIISAVKITKDKVVTTSFGYKSKDHSIKIWDRMTGECLYTPVTSRKLNQIVANDDKVIGLIDKKNIKIWDLNTGSLLYEYATKQKKHTIRAISVSYNKISFIDESLGKYDEIKSHGIKILDINTQKILHEFQFPGVDAAVINNDKVIAASINTIIIWDLITGKTLRKYKSSKFLGAMFTKGNKIVIRTFDNEISIIDINTNKIIVLAKESEPINPMEILNIQDNKLITRVKPSHTLKIWDIHTGELLFTGPDVCAGALIHNEIIIIGLLNDNNLYICDLKTYKPLRTLSGHRTLISSIAYDNDSIVTGSWDTTAKIWPITINLDGTAETNPLLWLIKKTNIAQLNFIQRACKAMSTTSEFIIIDWPQQLGTIHQSDSQEQFDGNIYFSLPEHVREYIRMRLNIRRASKTTKKYRKLYDSIKKQLL